MPVQPLRLRSHLISRRQKPKETIFFLKPINNVRFKFQLDLIAVKRRLLCARTGPSISLTIAVIITNARRTADKLRDVQFLTALTKLADVIVFKL